jgi:hypothetical protein
MGEHTGRVKQAKRSLGSLETIWQGRRGAAAQASCTRGGDAERSAPLPWRRAGPAGASHGSPRGGRRGARCGQAQLPRTLRAKHRQGSPGDRRISLKILRQLAHCISPETNVPNHAPSIAPAVADLCIRPQPSESRLCPNPASASDAGLPPWLFMSPPSARAPLAAHICDRAGVSRELHQNRPP